MFKYKEENMGMEIIILSKISRIKDKCHEFFFIHIAHLNTCICIYMRGR